MFSSTTVPTKSIPFVKTLFPGYRKREIRVIVSDSVTLHDLNWSGGTRSEYIMVDLRRKTTTGIGSKSVSPWDNKDEGRTIQIPEGHAVVQIGYFCGKQSMMRITFHPSVSPTI